MVEFIKETWGGNGVEAIVFNGKKWLNETNYNTHYRSIITLKFCSCHITISSKV